MYTVHSIFTPSDRQQATRYHIRMCGDVAIDTDVCFICQKRTHSDTVLRLDRHALEFVHTFRRDVGRGVPLPMVYTSYPHYHKYTKRLDTYFNENWACDDCVMAKALFDESFVPVHQSCLYSYMQYYIAFKTTHNIGYRSIVFFDIFSLMIKYYSMPYARALRQILRKAQRPVMDWIDTTSRPVSIDAVMPLAQYLSNFPVKYTDTHRTASRSPAQETRLWMRSVVALVATGALPNVNSVSFLRIPPYEVHTKQRNVFDQWSVSEMQMAQALSKMCFQDMQLFDSDGISMHL